MTETVAVHFQLDELVPSPYNRRKNKGDLKALADSLARHGILQPLVGRELPDGSVEIVAGERRLCAAQLAKLETVPVILREFNDQQAREACIDENLRREDIHPLDEAEGYEQLRDDHDYTVEQLADRFGRSKSYVHKRLKLTSLCKPARKLYREGKIDDRVAFAIARIADPAGQEALIEEAKTRFEPIEDSWEWDDFEKIIKRDHMADLASAPFDISDALLVHDAGSCVACPHRTGQQRELFPEAAKKEDLCLRRACYQTKLDVWWKLETAAAAKNGVKVLSAAEAKQELPWRGELRWGSPYVKPSEQLGRLAGDHKSKKTVKALLKKDPPQRFLARSEGKVVELYDRKEAVAKLKAAGHITKAAASKASSASRTTSSNKAAATREKKRRRTAERLLELAIAAAGDVVAELGDPSLSPLALLLCGVGIARQDAAKARNMKSDDLIAELEQRIADGDSGWVMRLVVELVIRDTYWPGRQGLGDRVDAALVAWGIDVAALEQQAKDEIAAEDKAAKDKAKAKAKKKAAKKKPAAKGKAKARG